MTIGDYIAKTNGRWSFFAEVKNPINYSVGEKKMYHPRKTYSINTWTDSDGIKLYAISAKDLEVDVSIYTNQLAFIKKKNEIDLTVPAFAIFHDGASTEYLIVGWWRNDNELFISVSVKSAEVWIEDMNRHSFCIWDLEVFWHERNSFIRHLYSGTKNLQAYREDLI